VVEVDPLVPPVRRPGRHDRRHPLRRLVAVLLPVLHHRRLRRLPGLRRGHRDHHHPLPAAALAAG
jgi:hypothetical protein